MTNEKFSDERELQRIVEKGWKDYQKANETKLPKEDPDKKEENTK